jgi:hypothetical protein
LLPSWALDVLIAAGTGAMDQPLPAALKLLGHRKESPAGGGARAAVSALLDCVVGETRLVADSAPVASQPTGILAKRTSG